MKLSIQFLLINLVLFLSACDLDFPDPVDSEPPVTENPEPVDNTEPEIVDSINDKKHVIAPEGDNNAYLVGCQSGEWGATIKEYEHFHSAETKPAVCVSPTIIVKEVDQIDWVEQKKSMYAFINNPPEIDYSHDRFMPDLYSDQGHLVDR